MAAIDDLGNAKINTNDLLAFQRELKQEKEFLQKVLIKIDDQLNSLQVEQLHLLGLMNKSLKATKVESPCKSKNDNEQVSINKSLDLSVPSTSKYYEEEMEDEEY
ncbi:hypothetical protein K0M31_020239 [Melipona bicolor]|uniref:Uncharacterized protein n=1 Tax=Melipona bicolor TaxID=60889 RepID=A0AA40G135_9HYME|nr:hypothetical protein K0M31_020239 [Melipona bicolor]